MRQKNKRDSSGDSHSPCSKKRNAPTASSSTQQPFSNSEASSTAFKSSKPVIIESNYAVINNLINTLSLEHKAFIKIISKQQVAVTCGNNDDKVKLIAKLRSQQFACHTFTEKKDRVNAFVLKGYFVTSTSILVKSLVDGGLQAKSATILKQSEDDCIYLVQFSNNTVTLRDLKQKHRHLDNVIVRWESYDKSKKRHVQCGNCKLWGHTSANCFRNYRCIKCTLIHERGCCSRTSKENTDDSRVQCVNCLGDHPANSTTCPKYIDFVSKLKGRHKPARTATKLAPAPPTHAWPLLSDNIANQSKVSPRQRASYAEVTQPAQISQPYLSETDFNPQHVSPNSQPFSLDFALETLKTQFQTMIDSLQKTFKALCQQLTLAYGH